MCFFAWGIMAVPPSVYVNDQNSWVTFVGSGIALLVMVALVYLLGSEATFEDIRDKLFFFMPVFAIFLAYFSFVRMLDANGILKHALSIGWNVATFGSAALALFAAVLRSREKGVDVEFLVPPIVFIAFALYGLGIGAYRLWGNNAMYLQIVFTTLYILGLSLISARKASLNDGAKIEKRCQLLAEEHGLSARETEILLLLAADYSNANIAERLTISSETVRTHKKRIFAKLDVHKHGGAHASYPFRFRLEKARYSGKRSRNGYPLLACTFDQQGCSYHKRGIPCLPQIGLIVKRCGVLSLPKPSIRLMVVGTPTRSAAFACTLPNDR